MGFRSFFGRLDWLVLGLFGSGFGFGRLVSLLGFFFPLYLWLVVLIAWMALLFTLNWLQDL